MTDSPPTKESALAWLLRSYVAGFPTGEADTHPVVINARAALAQPDEPSVWQPIETAPKDVALLLGNPRWQQQVLIGYFDTGYKDWTAMGVGIVPDPKFWAPMPPHRFPETKGE